MQELLYKDLFKQNNQRTYGNVSSNGAAPGIRLLFTVTRITKGYIPAFHLPVYGILWTPEIRNASSARNG